MTNATMEKIHNREYVSKENLLEGGMIFDLAMRGVRKIAMWDSHLGNYDVGAAFIKQDATLVFSYMPQDGYSQMFINVSERFKFLKYMPLLYVDAVFNKEEIIVFNLKTGEAYKAKTRYESDGYTNRFVDENDQLYYSSDYGKQYVFLSLTEMPKYL